MKCRLTYSRVTLTIDGDEADYNISAFVEVSPVGAMIDGWAQVYIKGQAHDIDLLNLSTADVENVTQVLCDQAIEDDVADYERHCA